MTARREFSPKTKVSAFKRDHGRCCECNTELRPGNVFYDHIIADANGGEPTLENCQCLCKVCHKLKTDLIDTPKAAETKRQHEKHIGAVRPKQRIPSPVRAKSGKRDKHPIARSGVSGISRQYVERG